MEINRKEILKKLASMYPHMEPALVYHNPFELLGSTILAAQCTDERVNIVKCLFLSAEVVILFPLLLK